jgi:hypothetical protein
MPDSFDVYIDASSIAVYTSGGITGLSSLTENKIMDFAQLPQGWDYGRGNPISARVIQAALTWNSRLQRLGFLNTNASPGSDGEIAVAAAVGDHRIEVIIETDGMVSVAYDFRRKQQFYRLRMQDTEVHQLVLELVGQIWNASTSFTEINMMGTQIAGSELLLGTIQDPYQSLDVTVSLVEESQFANTPENFMENSHLSSGSPQYFGGLTPIFYNLEAM